MARGEAAGWRSRMVLARSSQSVFPAKAEVASMQTARWRVPIHGQAWLPCGRLPLVSAGSHGAWLCRQKEDARMGGCSGRTGPNPRCRGSIRSSRGPWSSRCSSTAERAATALARVASSRCGGAPQSAFKHPWRSSESFLCLRKPRTRAISSGSCPASDGAGNLRRGGASEGEERRKEEELKQHGTGSEGGSEQASPTGGEQVTVQEEEKEERKKSVAIQAEKEEKPDYQQFAEWIQYEQLRQTATSAPEEGDQTPRIGPSHDDRARDGSPGSSSGGRRRWINGINHKVHDVLSDISASTGGEQGERPAGVGNVGQRIGHAARRALGGVRRPPFREVRGSGERCIDGQLGKCSILGSGPHKASRNRSNTSATPSSAPQQSSRKSRRKRLMGQPKKRSLGSWLQGGDRGDFRQRQRQRRKRKREEQEGKEVGLEREAGGEHCGRWKGKEGRVREVAGDRAERSDALKCALAWKPVTLDPYEELEEFSEFGARLKAAMGEMHEEADDERVSPVQDDPYRLDEVEEDCQVFCNLSAGPTSVAVRFEKGLTGLQCRSFESLGLWMKERVVSESPGRMLEAFAELLAPLGALGCLDWQSSRRWKLFPLPVSLIESSQTSGPRRSAGVSSEVWTNFALAGLNVLAGEKGPYPSTRKSKQIGRVVDSVRDRVERFLRGSKEEEVDPEKLWEDLISKRIGYDGEEMMQPVPLSYRQILLSVPPVGHGGSVAVTPLLEGSTRWLIEHPEECILQPSAREPGPNTAAVHIIPGDELAVWQLLEERGIIEWLPEESIFRDEQGPFLSGLFGVAKAGRFDDEGRQILRVIMNLKPVNRILRTLAGDIGELPMAPTWCQLKLCANEEMVFSQGDMQSAFYLFLMPPQWRPLFGFNSRFPCQALNRPGSGYLVPTCRVLPMGWASSVGVMQMISRRLLEDTQLKSEVELRRKALTPPWFVEECLRVGRDRWWQVYLDNFFTAEVRAKESPSQPLTDLHHAAMEAWDRKGVLNVPDKHVLGAREVVELGVRLNGDCGLIGASPQRVLNLVVVTLLLLEKKEPKRRWVQVVLGRWVFILQFKRQGMAILSRCWQYLRAGEDKRRWWPVVQKELASLILLAPLLQTDMFTSFDGLATCSDASESGGAVAVSSGLRTSGMDIANRLRDGATSPVFAPILVLSLFNGIGGAFRCFDIAGIQPHALVSVECDPAARRVTRRAWPQAIEVDDVKKVNVEMLRDWANQFPRITHVFILAGFPCVHLSSARAGRLNLEGEGSNLFWELERILQEASQVFEPLVKVDFVIENVASMDVPARDQISETLDVEPIMVCPSDCLPYNRPRLAWVSAELESSAGVTMERREGFTRVHMEGQGVEDADWVDEGWFRVDPGCHLPTFMKSIPRWSPPPAPAGIRRCSETDLTRWRSDDFRFPPYQYQKRYLFQNSSGDLRYASIEERQRLLGFGHNHVKYAFSASKAKASPQEYVDKQYSLLGDTFSMVSFAWIVSQLCRQWTSPLTPSQVVRRLGLAPGAGLASGLEAPLGRDLCYGAQHHPQVKPETLTAQLSRHVNHTGSDVSVALGVPYNTKGLSHESLQATWWQWRVVFSTRWKLRSHINALEMRMILQSIQWRARSEGSIGKRWVHLADSMVCNYILSKGRTSSRLLQPIVREINAYLLALNSTQYNAHVDSVENPTDEASRKP